MNVITIVVYKDEGGADCLFYSHNCELEQVKAIIEKTLDCVDKDIIEHDAKRGET